MSRRDRKHNNGGAAVNAWWESCVEGLFVVGEAAGTHGVYRPGGSALNAGQAGSTLAPDSADVEGFNAFMKRYVEGLAIQRAAIDHLKE